MGHVEGRIMDEDAQAHIRARSHLQSGSAVSWRLPKIVCGPKYPGLKCLRTDSHSPQTEGWPGLLRPAGSCTTHEESSISSIGSIGPDREMGVRRGNGILSLFPNPWRINLNIDGNLETRNAWRMKEICLIKMETMKNQLETFKGLFLGVNWYSRSHAGGRRLHGIYSSRWGYTSGQLSSRAAGQGSRKQFWISLEEIMLDQVGSTVDCTYYKIPCSIVRVTQLQSPNIPNTSFTD